MLAVSFFALFLVGSLMLILGIFLLIYSTTGKLQEENNVNLSESARISNNVRTVILGLFALIGFIILVFAVFTASIGAQLDQVQFANSVFIAAIVGAFTLVGVIVYQIRGSNGR